MLAGGRKKKANGPLETGPERGSWEVSCKVGAEGEEGGLVEDMNEKFNFFFEKKATFKNKKKTLCRN